MFDRVVVQQQQSLDPEHPVDLGTLVEAMLFYGSTRLIANSVVIKQLIETWTPEGAIELLERGHLQIVYHDNFAAISTDRDSGGHERHGVVVGSIMSHQRAVLGAQYSVPRLFVEICGRPGRGRRLARRFLDLIRVEQLDEGLPHRAYADLLDNVYLSAAAGEVMMSYAPEYYRRARPYFGVRDADGSLVVETSIDFVAANAEFHRTVSPLHSSLSPALLLSRVISARESLEHAATDDAEIATDSTNGAVMALKINRVLDQRRVSEERAARFQDLVVDNARAIREAVNRGDRGIDDVLELLKRAERFKKWLKDLSPNVELVKQYHRDSVAETWADKLPSKSLRLALFTGLGMGIDAAVGGAVGTAIGAGVGAFDTFVVDKLIRGWKPNQFVDSSLIPFVRR